MTSARHRWGEPARFEHKTERECSRCEMVKVTRHEVEAGSDVCWTEFWRDCELVGRGSPRPLCDARIERMV